AQPGELPRDPCDRCPHRRHYPIMGSVLDRPRRLCDRCDSLWGHSTMTRAQGSVGQQGRGRGWKPKPCPCRPDRDEANLMDSPRETYAKICVFVLSGGICSSLISDSRVPLILVALVLWVLWQVVRAVERRTRR